MSINTVVNTGTRNGKRDISPVYSLPQSETVASYTRPADWLTMPTVLSTDQKVVFLVAVENVSTNFFTITCTTSTGTYTVDWGDGTPNDVTTSNVPANHVFNWNNVSAGTLTTRGYRQAIVTVTPTSGNLLTVKLTDQFSVSGIVSPNVGWSNKILDCVVAGSNITQATLSSGTQQSSWMEICNILSLSSTASLAFTFNNAKSLQSVTIPNGNYTNLASMFASCTNLQAAPLFTFATTGSVDMSSMFTGCAALVSVPLYNTVAATTMNSMFANCFILNNIPWFNTINVIDMASMFSTCYALTSVPPFDTRNVTNMGSMFFTCYSLKNCPTFNTIKVTSTSNMFQNCYSLLVGPPFNLVACQNTFAMYGSCFILASSPAYNLPVCTNIGSMYINCYALTVIGDMTTSGLLTNMAQAFTQCRSLLTGPTISNTTNVNNMVELFYGCYAITSVPVYDTANVVNMNGMFGFTASLKNPPAINTIKAINFQSFFQGGGIVDAPTYNTSNVTSMALTFYQCRALRTVPIYDTANVTVMNAMFQDTSNLIEIPLLNTSNVTNFSAFINNSGIKRMANLNFSKATNISVMASGAQNLVTIPALNLTNVVTSGGVFTSCSSLSKAPVTNLRISTSFASSNLGIPELEQLQQGLIRITGAQQTLTISGNPGVGITTTKTGINFTANSNVVPMANTVGLSTGMLMNQLASISGGIGGPFTSANSTITLPMQLPNNTMISFSSVISSNVLANTIYYTEYYSGAPPTVGHQLKLTPAGATIGFTTGTGTARIAATIDTINTNSNIILNYAVSNNASSQSPVFRTLNTNYGTFLGWAITG